MDGLRDLLQNLCETALTMRSNRLNIITKQVTSWAAIIAVPTAVTGWFAQNIGFPGRDNFGGLITSTVLILGLSGGPVPCLPPAGLDLTGGKQP